MFDLEAAIDQWVESVLAAEPGLAEHKDEIADHLVMSSGAEIERGVSPEASLDLAIAALGPPDQLAAEFRRSRGLMAKIRCIAAAADREELTREQYLMAGAWIGFSLLWAAAMIRFENNLNWMLFGWVVTTFLPLTVLDAYFRRRSAKTSAS